MTGYCHVIHYFPRLWGNQWWICNYKVGCKAQREIHLGLFWVKIKLGGKVKIPSTLTTAFAQYTTEELDQLDQPWNLQTRGQEGEQYPTVPPLVYRITPQESLAGMDQESRKRDSPPLDQTVIRAGDKQDKFMHWKLMKWQLPWHSLPRILWELQLSQ